MVKVTGNSRRFLSPATYQEATMFDPNETLEALRDAYNAVQDGTLTLQEAEQVIAQLDDLDTHLMNGGELPDDWNL